MAPCATCTARGSTFSLREPGINNPAWEAFDATGGLIEKSADLFACPVCGTRYTRSVQLASMFHDYDEYYFNRVS
jgi:hypothetical protein